ncbi:MAG: hypothetical protein JXR69_06515 [Candidatus Delongbacteria bacterium]|nr:hypothetical protein [Candidatus Delongbacteria bacterium]
MAKVKCSFCDAKAGKRICKLKNGALICPVCCAKNRNEECIDCTYYQVSEAFTQKKQETVKESVGSYFGSPAMQKTIMEASMDLMGPHAAIGKKYDEDPDLFNSESFNFFSTDEFNEFSFTDDEIAEIIKSQGEPEATEGWFHTEAGVEYYTGAVNLIMNNNRFKVFSKRLMAIFLKYYRAKDIEKAWLILSTTNRLMEGDFTVPFTVLMFFKAISRWKLGKA